MKDRTLLLVLFVLVVVVSGCVNQQGISESSEPDEIVEVYINYIYDRNPEPAYDLVSEDIRDSYDDVREWNTQKNGRLDQHERSGWEFELEGVKTTEVTEDSAVVEYNISKYGLGHFQGEDERTTELVKEKGGMEDR